MFLARFDPGQAALSQAVPGHNLGVSTAHSKLDIFMRTLFFWRVREFSNIDIGWRYLQPQKSPGYMLCSIKHLKLGKP